MSSQNGIFPVTVVMPVAFHPAVMMKRIAMETVIGDCTVSAPPPFPPHPEVDWTQYMIWNSPVLSLLSTCCQSVSVWQRTNSLARGCNAVELALSLFWSGLLTCNARVPEELSAVAAAVEEEEEEEEEEEKRHSQQQKNKKRKKKHSLQQQQQKQHQHEPNADLHLRCGVKSTSRY